MSANAAERDAVLAWASASGQPGTFIDVGAGNWITPPLMQELAGLGWQGLCFEPAPDAAALLATMYGQNDDVLVFPFALSYRPDKAEVFYWTPGREQSSFHAARVAGMEAVPIVVACVHPSELAITWQRLREPIFLSIDAEGDSFELWKTMRDWVPCSCVQLELTPDERERFRANEFGWSVTCETEANIVAVYQGRRHRVTETLQAIPDLETQLHTERQY